MSAHVHAAVLLAALAALPGAALAQSGADALSARRAQAVAASPQGPTFRSAGQEYRVVPGLRAAPFGMKASAEAALTATDATPSDVLERKGPYLVLRAPAGTPAAAGTRAVAVNVRTGQLGVLTGTVTARVGSGAEATAAARVAGVALELFTPSTGYAFFRVPDGGDALSAAALLGGRPGVKGVDVEVKDSWDQPE